MRRHRPDHVQSQAAPQENIQDAQATRLSHAGMIMMKIVATAGQRGPVRRKTRAGPAERMPRPVTAMRAWRGQRAEGRRGRAEQSNSRTVEQLKKTLRDKEVADGGGRPA